MRRSVPLAFVVLLCIGQVRVTDCYPKRCTVVEPNGQGVTCVTRYENDDGTDICEVQCVVNVYVTFDADLDGDVDLEDYSLFQQAFTGE